MGKDRGAAAKREQQWQAHIDAWQSSGQTQRAFCRANRLKYANFCYWLRRFRAQGTAQPMVPPHRSKFVPVVATGMAGGGSSGLSAHLPGGIELRGINEQNIELVAQLLDHLR